MIDVELLDPSFGGLNFSITGNMRAGIFVKEILDRNQAHLSAKATTSNSLRIGSARRHVYISSAALFKSLGDRIIALTVCFDSIVYEDALTILSYASPYPVRRSSSAELPKLEKQCSLLHRSSCASNDRATIRKGNSRLTIAPSP